MAAGREEVFFVRREWDVSRNSQPAAFSIRADEQVPVDAIAKHFGVIPHTATVGGLDRSLTLAEVRRRLKSHGTASSPFLVFGYLGPFAAHFQADFQYFKRSESTRLEVRELLHLSQRCAIYSCGVVDSHSGGGEELVLKLILKELSLPLPVLGSEVATLEEIMELKATFLCPSLPEFLGHGIFVAGGGPHPGAGDATGWLIKPRGECVAGRHFGASQVCKAAFDVFLALYHLYLLERRHRAVKTENMIYVQQQEQFVLIDFGRAYGERWDAYMAILDEVPDAVALVRSLAELAGWDHTAGAAVVLARVHPVLGRFAEYASTLLSAKEFPAYDYWLRELAGCCGVHSSALRSMMKKTMPVPGLMM